MKNPDQRAGWRHTLFVLYVLFLLLLFLLPLPTTPLAESRHLDKLVHFGAFMVFALLFYVDRHRKLGWTFLLSVAFAGAIELIQWTLPYRDADWLDFMAGVAGAALGTLSLAVLGRRTGGRAGTDLTRP